MKWRLEWTERALKDAERLDRPIRERVVVAAEKLAETGQGRIKCALYLAPKATMIQLVINPGMIDRRSRGPLRPCASQGRHALLRNEPEQLRGPLSPYHARPGHQGGRDDEYSGLCRD